MSTHAAWVAALGAAPSTAIPNLRSEAIDQMTELLQEDDWALPAASWRHRIGSARPAVRHNWCAPARRRTPRCSRACMPPLIPHFFIALPDARRRAHYSTRAVCAQVREPAVLAARRRSGGLDPEVDELVRSQLLLGLAAKVADSKVVVRKAASQVRPRRPLLLGFAHRTHARPTARLPLPLPRSPFPSPSPALPLSLSLLPSSRSFLARASRRSRMHLRCSRPPSTPTAA